MGDFQNYDYLRDDHVQDCDDDCHDYNHNYEIHYGLIGHVRKREVEYAYVHHGYDAQRLNSLDEEKACFHWKDDDDDRDLLYDALDHCAQVQMLHKADYCSNLSWHDYVRVGRVGDCWMQDDAQH